VDTRKDRSTAGNTGLAKVAVQCSADTFVVNQHWFSASAFVVKSPPSPSPKTLWASLNDTTADRDKHENHHSCRLTVFKDYD
jgi:hypothetical protein